MKKIGWLRIPYPLEGLDILHTNQSGKKRIHFCKSYWMETSQSLSLKESREGLNPSML
jgi:hypothetical protein